MRSPQLSAAATSAPDEPSTVKTRPLSSFASLYVPDCPSKVPPISSTPASLEPHITVRLLLKASAPPARMYVPFACPELTVTVPSVTPSRLARLSIMAISSVPLRSVKSKLTCKVCAFATALFFSRRSQSVQVSPVSGSVTSTSTYSYRVTVVLMVPPRLIVPSSTAPSALTRSIAAECTSALDKVGDAVPESLEPSSIVMTPALATTLLAVPPAMISISTGPTLMASPG